MLAGVVRAAMKHVSIAAALTDCLAFPAGRILGIILDGMASGAIIGALVVELVIAALLHTVFTRRRLILQRFVDLSG